MIVEAIEPLALRIPNQEATLHLIFCGVIEGFGECLCLRPAIQHALVATICDAIAPIYLGQVVANRLALNLEVRRRFASFVNMMRMLTAPGLSVQSAMTLTTAGSSSSTMANRLGWACCTSTV